MCFEPLSWSRARSRRCRGDGQTRCRCSSARSRSISPAMASHPLQGLPFLPGNSFRDPTKTAYHRSQTLEFRNGFSRSLLPTVGIGRDPITANQLSQAELDELANKRPTLTYGQAKPAPPSDFIPAHVAFDKKVLRFDAYFQETVPISQEEYYRVRKVDVYYYLEDDSIAIVEPPVDNSGIPQGKFMKRQRQPKNDCGDHYHWKDLNLGINITIYGKTMRIVNCDAFTQEFMESEGIELNPPEAIPPDPYTEHRRQPPHTTITPSDFDKLRQFLTMDRKVLRFFAVWDDTDSMFGEARPVIIHYYLNDDTVEIREVHERNDGRDPFPVLMKRQHLPKSIKDLKVSFPACVLEISDHEVTEWYSPSDFIVGSHITILGRKFFLHDCDEYTRIYYRDCLGLSDLQPVDVSKKTGEEVKQELPPYNGYGLLEDSIQNCLSLVPRPPKKDVMKMLENDRKVLRYAAVLDSVNPEDKLRRFILSYYLSNDMISIFEPQVRNSGIIGGKFLERTKVPKPGSPLENPSFYGPADFTIGAVVEVFGHRFIITDADEYVLNYIQVNSDIFPSEVLNSLHKHLRSHKEGGHGGTCVRCPVTEQSAEQSANEKPAEQSAVSCQQKLVTEQLATGKPCRAKPATEQMQPLKQSPPTVCLPCTTFKKQNKCEQSPVTQKSSTETPIDQSANEKPAAQSAFSRQQSLVTEQLATEKPCRAKPTTEQIQPLIQSSPTVCLPCVRFKNQN